MLHVVALGLSTIADSIGLCNRSTLSIPLEVIFPTGAGYQYIKITIVDPTRNSAILYT